MSAPLSPAKPSLAAAWRSLIAPLAITLFALGTLYRVYDRPMVFNADAVRDIAAALDVRDGTPHGFGPGVYPLGFFLSPFYNHLVAFVLAVRPSLAALAFAEKLAHALGVALVFAIARRAMPAWGALLAALFALHAGALVEAHQVFTHAGFLLPFELVFVLALVHSIERDRPAWLVLACGAFGVALQLHTTVAPLVLLLVVPAWQHHRTRVLPWWSVVASVVAFVSPAAVFVHAYDVWGVDLARGSVLDALVAQHTLPLLALALTVVARPAALLRRDGVTLFVAAWLAVAWVALIGFENRSHTVLALFNYRLGLRGADPIGGAVGAGWTDAALRVAGLSSRWPRALSFALVALAFGGMIRQAFDRTSPLRPFLLTWAALTVPPALYALARVDAIAVRYALHASPVCAVAAASAVVVLVRDRLDARRLTGGVLALVPLAAGPAPRPFDLMDGRVVERVWRAVGAQLGSPGAVAMRVHGGDELPWGDTDGTAWVLPPLVADQHGPDDTSDTHILLVPFGTPASVPIDGTDLAMQRYHPRFDGAHATWRVEGGAWAPVTLPLRRWTYLPMALPAWLRPMAATRLPETARSLDVRVPVRRIETHSRTVSVAFDTPSRARDCVITASMAGVDLVPVTGDRRERWRTFALPSTEGTDIEIAVRNCVLIFLDVYDP